MLNSPKIYVKNINIQLSIEIVWWVNGVGKCRLPTQQPIKLFEYSTKMVIGKITQKKGKTKKNTSNFKRAGDYWHFFYFLRNRKENYFAFFIENNTP